MISKDIEKEFIRLIESNAVIIFKVCNAYFDTSEERRDIYQENYCIFIKMKREEVHLKLMKLHWILKIIVNSTV